MRELKLVTAESDAQSLVLVPIEHDEHDESGEEFFIVVTDALRSLLNEKPGAEPKPSTAEVAETATEQAAEPSGVADKTLDQGPAHLAEKHDNQEAPAEPASGSNGFGTKPQSSRPHRSRISLSPRTIQNRIRHGASIADLATEADTDESRIEPYAWPILQERARIAELARSARPVTNGTVSEHTLWESLAASFGARDEDVSQTTWDARQNHSSEWVVTVTWEKAAAGQTNTHDAEFTFEPDPHGGASLVHPLDSVARDLIDPRFGNTVRSVTPVTPLHGTDDTTPGPETDDPADMLEDDPTAHDATDIFANTSGDNPHRVDSPAGSDSQAPEDPDEEFLLHPTSEQSKKRRRKAVTPHWEDVLLGVRTNPKKKK